MITAADLHRLPLFSGLPAPLVATLVPRLVPRRYRAGEVIFHQGDAATSLQIIESGQVKIMILSEKGEELLVDILSDGDFFGEPSLLDGHPRTATAVASTNTQTYTLDRQEFLSFLRNSPEATIAICTVLAGRLRHANERLAESAFLDLPQRLGRYLLHLSKTYGHETPEGTTLDLPLSQREMGGLVGSTRQSVNKVLSQWEQAGVVRRQGRSLILLHPERFRDFV